MDHEAKGKLYQRHAEEEPRVITMHKQRGKAVETDTVDCKRNDKAKHI